jgi:hypothetical protein
MYERLLEVQSVTDADLVTSDLVSAGKIIENNLESNRMYYEAEIKREILPLFTFNHSIATYEFKNKIIRKAIIDNNQIRFYEEFSYQEDLMFMINIYGNIKSLYYIHEPFYEYYPLSTGLYSSYRENGGIKFVEAREKIISLIEKYDIAIDQLNFNTAFLYNISFYIYRTLNYKPPKYKVLICDLLKNKVVIACCQELIPTASSFDRRIASCIYHGNTRMAICLIKFVYSGKAAKTQNVLLKIRNH